MGEVIRGIKSGRTFELGRVEGYGGYGVVYRARENGMDFALKLARPRGEESHNAILKREARIQAEFRHPNITQVVLCDKTKATRHQPGETFLVTPLALLDLKWYIRIARSSLSTEDAVAISGQTAAALAEIHRRGYAHQDIKASNILVARKPDGRIHSEVTDFGSADKKEENNNAQFKVDLSRWAEWVVYPAVAGSMRNDDGPFPRSRLEERQTFETIIGAERMTPLLDALEPVVEIALDKGYPSMVDLHEDLVRRQAKARRKMGRQRTVLVLS